MAYKAARVRSALERNFRKVRQHGSHAIFRIGSRIAIFAYHDRVELADRELRKVASEFGLTLEELKGLL